MPTALAAAKRKQEEARIENLYDLDILDTPSEDVFDDIVDLCRDMFGCAISLVSLVDKERQWFKAKSGLDVDETPREQSFCAHAILSDDVMVIHDARADPRFSANPLVTDAPFIRFYAGAPIKTRAGFNIGTLCVIDGEAHEAFSETDKSHLSSLSAIVADRMLMRQANNRRGQERFRSNIRGWLKAYRRPAVEVMVYDISEGGAMLQCSAVLPAKGEEVELAVGTRSLVATIAWQKDGFCGLTFHRHISRPQVDGIRGIAKH